jgi:hemerythrin superfamily protein
MEQYDKEFLEYMKTKYKLTLNEATKGTEPQIIKFAIAWDVWKQAKSAYSKREQDIYEFMSRDHSRLDYIFQEFRKSKKVAEAEQLFLEFSAGIERHMSWEEDILFPLVKKKMGGDSPMIDELIVQHNRIKDDLRGLADSLKPRDTALEDDLEQLLAAHDKMEEEDMYPWIDNYLDDTAKKEALSRMV